jgi:enoyl-CoA hydratase/carnithine racemase
MPGHADQPIPGLEYEVADRVAYLTINRPERLNALTAAMYSRLRTHVIRADLDDDVDIIVLRSTGDRAFCTGGDLVESAGLWEDENGLAERLGELDGRLPFPAFERCSKTILTAVNGLAQAAGLIAVLVSDLVIASDQARFRVPETRRGLTEPYIPRRLAQTIGLARARWMIYTAEEIDAAQALAWGLVAKVVPHAQLEDAVAQAVTALRRTGPQSRSHYKRMISQTLPAITLDEYVLSMRSPEALEGLRAFAEKRRPAWDRERADHR